MHDVWKAGAKSTNGFKIQSYEFESLCPKTVIQNSDVCLLCHWSFDFQTFKTQRYDLFIIVLIVLYPPLCPMLKFAWLILIALNAPLWDKCKCKCKYKWPVQAAFKILPSAAIIPSALWGLCAIKMQPGQRKCDKGKHVEDALSYSQHNNLENTIWHNNIQKIYRLQ